MTSSHPTKKPKQNFTNFGKTIAFETSIVAIPLIVRPIYIATNGEKYIF